MHEDYTGVMTGRFCKNSVLRVGELKRLPERTYHGLTPLEAQAR